MFRIGGIEFSGRLFLAPMAGVLSSELRLAFRNFGFALSAVGFVSAQDLVISGGRDLKSVPGRLESIDPREKPLMIQLVGSSESSMAQAACFLNGRADIIDLNFGCPVPSVMKRGQGAALLEEPEKMERIVRSVVRRAKVPVTAKIRLAESGFRQTIDCVQRCQGAGASAVIVHARTAGQYFQGRADWSVFPEIKKHLSIPLVGNGGVGGKEDAELLLKEYGCDFVMVGAAAIRNPQKFMTSEAVCDPAAAFMSIGGGHLTTLIRYWLSRNRMERFIGSWSGKALR